MFNKTIIKHQIITKPDETNNGGVIFAVDEILQVVPLDEVDHHFAAQQTSVRRGDERQSCQLLGERGHDAFGHVGGLERFVKKVEEPVKKFGLKLALLCYLLLF